MYLYHHRDAKGFQKYPNISRTKALRTTNNPNCAIGTNILRRSIRRLTRGFLVPRKTCHAPFSRYSSDSYFRSKNVSHFPLPPLLRHLQVVWSYMNAAQYFIGCEGTIVDQTCEYCNMSRGKCNEFKKHPTQPARFHLCCDDQNEWRSAEGTSWQLKWNQALRMVKYK